VFVLLYLTIKREEGGVRMGVCPEKDEVQSNDDGMRLYLMASQGDPIC